MRSVKRYILTSFFLIVSIFFISIDNADAKKLSVKYYTVQCIYGDGGLYTRSVDFGRTNFNDGSEWKYTNNRTTYNLRGTSDVDNNSTGSFTFVNKINKEVDYSNPSWTCQSHVKNAIYDYSSDGGEGGKSFYKFGGSSVEISNEEFGTSKTGWQSFWGITSASEEAAENARSAGKRHKLVSESYILSANAPAPDKTVYYVQEAEQASGSNKYIEIMIYSNAVLLKSDSLITQVRYGEGAGWFVNRVNTSDMPYTRKNNNEFPKTICINSPEAMVDTTGGAKLSYYYNDGQVRYTVGSPTNNSCESNETNIYKLTEEPPINLNTDTGALCTKIMPKTAIILREIIKYTQILVPILLIVLVGIDIGKVVMAGNVEEELPKIRTRIIVRIVVALCFFFLPLIVNLVLGIVKTSGDAKSSTIELIGCLFQ